MRMKRFDYEAKIWGVNKVRLNPIYLGALRLKYCLNSLEKVKGRVLEVGCGAGGMTKAVKFYRSDLEVYGCDISKTAINYAKKNPQGVKFSVGDAYKLPFSDKSFDGIFLFDILEHLENPEKAVGEIYRVLKNGAVFHSYTPCEGSPSNYDFWFRKLGWKGKERYAGHIQKFNAKDLEKMMKKQGFNEKEKKWSNHISNQLFDALYFLMLSLRGKNAKYSVEGFASQNSQNIQTKIAFLMIKIVAILSFFESYYLSKIPGHGVHLTAFKK